MNKKQLSPVLPARTERISRVPLKKGYVVHGIKRRSSLFNTDRIDHLYADPH